MSPRGLLVLWLSLQGTAWLVLGVDRLQASLLYSSFHPEMLDTGGDGDRLLGLPEGLEALLGLALLVFRERLASVFLGPWRMERHARATLAAAVAGLAVSQAGGSCYGIAQSIPPVAPGAELPGGVLPVGVPENLLGSSVLLLVAIWLLAGGARRIATALIGDGAAEQAVQRATQRATQRARQPTAGELAGNAVLPVIVTFMGAFAVHTLLGLVWPGGEDPELGYSEYSPVFFSVVAVALGISWSLMSSHRRPARSGAV